MVTKPSRAICSAAFLLLGIWINPMQGLTQRSDFRVLKSFSVKNVTIIHGSSYAKFQGVVCLSPVTVGLNASLN
jgi:hypothetical protein